MDSYSVLMSVYHKEKAEHLYACLQSMIDQTVVTNDFVIVCDGPLTAELDDVLDEYTCRYPGVFNVVRLPKNVGIGAAANIGLRYCKNNLVAKMDSDDISVPERCEKQLKLFRSDPNLTVAGGYIAEFAQCANSPFSIRMVPTENADIRKFARRRQPFNNVSVMYRRDAVLAVGGYRDLYRCEDYDLYIRLLNAGYRAQNIPEVLVNVRVNQNGMSRRASFATLRGVIRSRWSAVKIGYASIVDFFVCVLGEIVIVISPAFVRQFIYNHLFRHRC